MLHHGRVMHLLAEAVLNRGVTVESPHCQHTDNVYAVYSGRGAQGRGGPCFNMSRRLECSDIPALECVIGPEIHVTHFQRLVRELHSEHISPFKQKKKKIRGQRDLVTQGTFSFSFSVLLRGANVSHAGKQMCACTNLCDCVGGGPLAHVRVRVRLRCSGAQGARSSRVAARQILFLQITVRPRGKD